MNLPDVLVCAEESVRGWMREPPSPANPRQSAVARHKRRIWRTHRSRPHHSTAAQIYWLLWNSKERRYEICVVSNSKTRKVINQCCGSGSGAFLTPRSGMGKQTGSRSGIRIRDDQPGSYFRELRNQFVGLKYLNYLMGIRDPRWKKFGSGMENIRIRDPG